MVIDQISTQLTYKIEPSISEESDSLLEELYKSTYSLKVFAETEYPDAEKYTFTIYSDSSAVQHVFMFTRRRRSIIVINRLCEVEDQYIELFCRACFDEFKEVNTISFTNFFLEPKLKSFKYFTTMILDDYIIHLPESIEAYGSSLGKSQKRNLNYYVNRATRDYPDFGFAVYEKTEVPPSLLEKAAQFNKMRMREKRKASGLDEKKMANFSKWVEERGYVSAITLDGKVVSVTVSTVVKDRLYFHIISHDPDYNFYRLGQIILYLTIKSFIEKGGKEFHMLWGEYSYKYQFRAEKAVLYSFAVIRYGYLKNWLVLLSRIGRAKASLMNKIGHLQNLTFKEALEVIVKKGRTYLIERKSKNQEQPGITP